IVELKNLQSLYLSGNGFTALPKEIVELKNLQSLDLSRNGLKEFPKEITKLSRLSSLHFSSFFKDKDSNKIKSIPNEFIELTVLFDFNIEADSLDTFYKTSYKSGLENLKNTIQQKIKQGTDKLYEAKLLFVGESGAGKTSLMEKILDKKYQLKTSENDNSTIGIDIRKHTFPYTKNKKIIFRTNMWDFGGQQVQYMSHQFFLTPNSLYVLVGDNRKQHTDFDYWFHIINLLSDDSPILVVLNDINHKSVTNFDLKAFKERFNTHTIEQKDIDLSNIVDGRYDELKLKIENMLCNLPHIGEDLPARWIDIRDQINILAESNYFIPFEEFRQISEGFGLSDEDISTLARHFHNLGVFLHYGDDISGLADTIFLNPKWVMDAIYSVLADTSVNQNNGKFTKKWLFNFWEEQHQGYTLDIKNKLLTLMLKDKFEICYRLQTGKESYMSPQLLPPVLDYEYEWDYKNNLFYRFQYPFMPRGIISRLIVRLNNLIYQKNNKEIVWQKGVVLEYENAKAEVREKKTKEGLKVIDISIKGDKIDSSTLLSKIKSEIENIHNSSFKNINCDEMIPCCCSECKNSKEPNFFEFKTLKKYIQKNSFFIKCDKSIEEVSISELLGNVTVKNDKSKESDVLEYLEKREFKVQVINNIKSDSSTMITDSFKQSQTTKITITQSIGEVTSTLSSLQKKVGGIDEKEEISDLITDFKKLGENPTKEAIKDSGVLTDLKGLITDFDEKMHNTGEVITQTTKAIRTAKALGRAYNDLASLCGLPTVPFFLLK
ncbi:MAG: COR domain-containing protein, partial [Sulfurospirillaceae bacterium]|nr:COR domain-containing protein [Sulfurospirillaceae bacterium]